MRESKVLLLSLVAVLALLALQGCEEEELVRPDRNRPPETILSVAPEHGDRAFHKYRVRWTGLDRDGVVVEYRVATVAEDELYGGRTSPEDIEEYLFDLPWTVTDATESLFVFRADRPNSRNHSLYVVGVDNEGKEDPTPALTNFLAIDYGLPVIEICMANNVTRFSRLLNQYIPAGMCVPTSPKGDTLPKFNFENPGIPITFTMKWVGDDPDGDVTSYRYRLDSQAEVEVEADVDSAVFRYDPDDVSGSNVWTGFHEFRVVAVDDAGAESQESVTRFVINYDPDTVIDSVWTFRRKVDNDLANVDSLPMKLIYARAWRDSPEVYGDWGDSLRYSDYAYHFGQIKIKFHGSDVDGPPEGPPPSEFRWDIAGTLLKSDWVSAPDGFCNGVACYSDTTKQKPYLDSDREFRLSARSRDDINKADGSPDTIMFFVNIPPKIDEGSLSHQPLTGQVRFTWDAHDPDEGYGWGIRSGEQEQALIKYRYRIDGGLWQDVQRKTRNPTRFRKEATIEDLEPGPHRFELHAYNGDYFETRADKDTLDFEL
jgi:hypothetical protein